VTAEFPAMRAFTALIRATCGLHIGADKLYLIETRLAPIQRSLGLPSLAALIERVQSPGHADLLRTVVDALTTNESLFFRDEKPFAHLRDTLPKLAATRPPGQPLRIWSAAASSGQEPYSIAMVVAQLSDVLQDRQVEILATDIARTQLARAREGLYTDFEVQRGLPAHLRARYFRREGENWRIDGELRARVIFREWNLLHEPGGLGRFDFVFCRNVLIYFDAATKQTVLANVAATLRQDGYLYLGSAETPVGLSDRFAAVPATSGAYMLADRPARRTSEGSAPHAQPRRLSLPAR
jgi:chemotaxis protein methyltransferase CheR